MDNVWLITVLGIDTALLAVIFLWLVTGRFTRAPAGKSKVEEAKAEAPLSGNPGAVGSELVAVIAAAVAAASGAVPGSFRIASIAPSAGVPGINTPIWGRIERYVRD